MDKECAEKLTRNMLDLLSEAQTKLKASLRQGLPVNEYQIQDNTHRAVGIALDILDVFRSDMAANCANPIAVQCLELIRDRQENRWKELAEDDYLKKMTASAGFLGADIGLLDDAEDLFEQLALLSPDDVNPLLGLTYVKIFDGELHQAADLLRKRVLQLEPGNDLGLAFLALACAGLNRPEEALAAASAVITANRDENAVNLAREIHDGLSGLAN